MHRILVVEDDDNIGRAVRDRLNNAGYETEVFTSGHEALCVAENNSWDLVILDVMLPDMDGYALLESLRILESTRNSPVIFLSVTDDIERSMKAGAFTHIVKPFKGAKLLEAVKSALS